MDTPKKQSEKFLIICNNKKQRIKEEEEGSQSFIHFLFQKTTGKGKLKGYKAIQESSFFSVVVQKEIELYI